MDIPFGFAPLALVTGKDTTVTPAEDVCARRRAQAKWHCVRSGQPSRLHVHAEREGCKQGPRRRLYCCSVHGCSQCQNSQDDKHDVWEPSNCLSASEAHLCFSSPTSFRGGRNKVHSTPQGWQEHDIAIWFYQQCVYLLDGSETPSDGRAC